MLRMRWKCFRGFAFLFVVAGLIAMSGAGLAASWTYPRGDVPYKQILDGVVVNEPNGMELESPARFDVIWIANTGEDTVSKLRVDKDDPSKILEIARYRTWFDEGTHGYEQGPAPSRIAVDRDGNAYVLNQMYPDAKGNKRSAVLIKILSSDYIDRNCDGQIQTSSGGAAIKLEDKNGNGKLDDEELADERVAWAREVGPPGGLGKALCIDPDGSIWVGLHDGKQYWVLDSDGTSDDLPIAVDYRPLGCDVTTVVDSSTNETKRLLFGVDDGSDSPPAKVVSLDIDNVSNQKEETYATKGWMPYALALGNGKVYVAQRNESSPSKATYLEVSIDVTATARLSDSVPFDSLAIAVDRQGNIVTFEDRAFVGSFVEKFTTAGKPVWRQPNPGTGIGGLVVDNDNKIWVISRDNSLVTILQEDGTPIPDAQIKVGAAPWTYGDPLGFGGGKGSWVVVTDSRKPGTEWQKISWIASAVEDGIEVRARAADDEAGLCDGLYESVTNGVELNEISGQFIQIEVSFTADVNGESPLLDKLVVESIEPEPEPEPVPGDLNGDGLLNAKDYYAFIATYLKCNGRTGYLPAADYDGDSCITYGDFMIWYRYYVNR
jgi:DNA-binding beta-propeller fold protein YncE